MSPTLNQILYMQAVEKSFKRGYVLGIVVGFVLGIFTLVILTVTVN